MEAILSWISTLRLSSTINLCQNRTGASLCTSSLSLQIGTCTGLYPYSPVSIFCTTRQYRWSSGTGPPSGRATMTFSDQIMMIQYLIQQATECYRTEVVSHWDRSSRAIVATALCRSRAMTSSLSVMTCQSPGTTLTHWNLASLRWVLFCNFLVRPSLFIDLLRLFYQFYNCS